MEDQGCLFMKFVWDFKAAEKTNTYTFTEEREEYKQ